MKYFRIIPNGYDKIGGVLFAPKNWPHPIARDGYEVENWTSLIVELRDGEYRHFNQCVGGANIVTEEFKNLLLSYIGADSNIEFLPVKAKSEKYGDRLLYILHFKIIYDVINKKKTIYVEGTDSILKLRLDKDKVKNLKIFNSQPAIRDVIVSEDVYKAIKKNKLNSGIIFREIAAV